jgi:cell division protein FtsZ
MVNPGLVNLDFADIRTVMAEMGKAMMGTGESEGEGRAVKAAEAAISNPLLEDTSMRGARGVLINITGGYDMTLFEVDEAANRIRKEVDEDANIIFGSSIDETMNGRLRVSVVATGIDAAVREAERPKLVAMGGGAAPVHAVATQAVPQQQPAARTPGGFTPRVSVSPPVPGAMRPAQPYGAPSPTPIQPTQPVAQAPMAEPPVMLGQAHEPGLRAPVANRPTQPPQPVSAGINSLFKRATGLMRRDLPDAAPVQQAPRPEQPAPRPVAQPTQQEEMGLDIPTFLRRQSN